MQILLALTLLSSCADRVETPVSQPVSQRSGTAAEEPIVLSDAQLGVMYEDGAAGPARRTITLSGRTALTIMCTGRTITFTFDANERSHAFACGRSNGYIGSGGPMTIRLEEAGAKYDVPVVGICDGGRTVLTVSANRTFASVYCPMTGTEKPFDGDSAFVDYVVD